MTMRPLNQQIILKGYGMGKITGRSFTAPPCYQVDTSRGRVFNVREREIRDVGETVAVSCGMSAQIIELRGSGV